MPNTVTVVSMDRLSNVATVRFIAILDTVEPFLDVQSHQDGDWVSTSEVTITGIVEAGCTLTVDGHPVVIDDQNGNGTEDPGQSFVKIAKGLAVEMIELAVDLGHSLAVRGCRRPQALETGDLGFEVLDLVSNQGPATARFRGLPDEETGRDDEQHDRRQPHREQTPPRPEVDGHGASSFGW